MSILRLPLNNFFTLLFTAQKNAHVMLLITNFNAHAHKVVRIIKNLLCHLQMFGGSLVDLFAYPLQ